LASLVFTCVEALIHIVSTRPLWFRTTYRKFLVGLEGIDKTPEYAGSRWVEWPDSSDVVKVVKAGTWISRN